MNKSALILATIFSLASQNVIAQEAAVVEFVLVPAGETVLLLERKSGCVWSRRAIPKSQVYWDLEFPSNRDPRCIAIRERNQLPSQVMK